MNQLENHLDQRKVKTESTESSHQVEKILNNDDFYTDQWRNNFPYGQRKYLWTDGCYILFFSM